MQPIQGASFQGRHDPAVFRRSYLPHALSDRDLAETMAEWSLPVDPTTIYRRVQSYVPKLEKRLSHN